MDYTSFGDLHLNRAIGDYFVRQERLTPADLDRAISHQEILGGRLDTVLLAVASLARGDVLMATVRRLVVKAGLAIQVYILKNRIHVA